MANNKHKWVVPTTFLVALIMGLVAGVIFILTSKTEVRTSENTGDTVAEALLCSARNVKNAFFASGNSNTNNYIVKILFHDNVPYKINYNYEGAFNTEKEAVDADALMHADYNLYMAKFKLDSEKLYPTFVADNSKVKINLYLEKSTLNSITAKFIFLDDNEFEGFYGLGKDKLRSLYEEKGFKCNFNN